KQEFVVAFQEQFLIERGVIEVRAETPEEIHGIGVRIGRLLDRAMRLQVDLLESVNRRHRRDQVRIKIRQRLRRKGEVPRRKVNAGRVGDDVRNGRGNRLRDVLEVCGQ